MSSSDNGTNPTLRLQGVGKWFGSLHVLDDIDIDVKTQEILTVLGPSGCGKTTLLRIVNGLILCERGEVSFKGELVDGPSPRWPWCSRTSGFSLEAPRSEHRLRTQNTGQGEGRNRPLGEPLHGTGGSGRFRGELPRTAIGRDASKERAWRERSPPSPTSC